MNNGQACVAQTRILVVARAATTRSSTRSRPRVGEQKVGDPLDPTTVVGPLVAARQRDRVEGYIAHGREEGARVVVGGGRPAGLDTGWYVEPTVFVDVDNAMRIAREEIFGPVLAVIPYDDARRRGAHRQRLRLRPLGFGVDGRRERGLEIARRVRTGTYGVNGSSMDFGAPFGGFK